MKRLAIAIVLLATPALAQQQQTATPRPTADQITMQVMEQEIGSFRKQIGLLAAEVNRLTDELAAVSKQRDELKQKYEPPPVAKEGKK